MRNHPGQSSQRGAALVIGLILLAVITLLAVVGMNISNSELSSATSEQLRLRAFQAAETAVEYAMWRDNPTENDISDTKPICKNTKITPVTVITGSPVNSAGTPTDRYTSRIAFVDTGAPDGFSGGTFIAYHYIIETQGSSARNAVAKHKQGAYLINKNQGDTFTDYTKECFVSLPSTY
jgi:hypothetical protein